MDSRYSTDFADHRRSSFQDVPAECSGEIVWAKGLPEKGGATNAVRLFGSRIALIQAEGVSVYSQEGTPLFTIESAPGTPVGITDSIIYYMDLDFRLSAITFAGEHTIKSGYFPGILSDDYPVNLMWAGNRDYLYVIQFNGGPQELPRKIFVKRTSYGDRLSEWTYSVEADQIMPPLYIEEAEQAVLFADMVYFVSSADGGEISRFEPPLEVPLLASAGPDGTVYVSGTEEGAAAVAAFSSSQQKKWKWVDEEGGLQLSRRQPPVVGADGRVYLIAGPKVVALENGEKAWDFEAEEAVFSQATLFADNRLVVTAGNRLIGIGGNGKGLFDVEFDDSIIAPPVGAGDGTLYLLTSKEILKVQ